MPSLGRIQSLVGRKAYIAAAPGPGFSAPAATSTSRQPRKYLAMDELEDHNVLRTTPYVDTVTYQLAPQRERIGTNRVRRNFLRTYIGKSFRCTHTRLRLLYYGVNYDPMY